MFTLDNTEAWTNDNPDAERQLWAAVILQAIEDATGPASTVRSVQRERDRTDARNWLTKPNRDFNQVCALAGIDPDRVRAAALIKIEEADQQTRASSPPRRSLITHNGRTMSAEAWSKETGINANTIRKRVERGVNDDELFAPPDRKRTRKVKRNDTILEQAA